MSTLQIKEIEPKTISIIPTRFATSQIDMARFSQGGAQLLYKRVLDVVLAVVALVVLAPLFLIISILVKLDSSGPVFYSGPRIGKGGRTFDCLKFRTMRINAPELLQSYLEHDEAAAVEWRRTHKLKYDPRVSRLGRFLRTSSLDELPQLWNVLAGDMSLVGPRPIVEAEIPKYGDVFDLYVSVVPGMTGLWQVSGRSNTTYAQRVRLDARYVTEWNLFMDLWIMAKTIPAVINCRGAY